MSTPAYRNPAASAPLKGSFPLDHFAQCKKIADAYQKCVKDFHFDGSKCRYLSKEYLACRMDNQLMARESFEYLGFTEADVRPPEGSDGKAPLPFPSFAKKKSVLPDSSAVTMIDGKVADGSMSGAELTERKKKGGFIAGLNVKTSADKPANAPSRGGH